MKMTVTFTPEEIVQLVRDALSERTLRPVTKPEIIVTNETRGDFREQWTEAVFKGVTVEVTDDFK